MVNQELLQEDLPSSCIDQEQTNAVEAARKVLISKMNWATCELAKSSSVEYCSQLCVMIQASCTTLKQLETLSDGSH